jgi:bifunctional NMN adenylyltransferase/nudix hydrolase
MKFNSTLGVVVGRFQPLHKGHCAVIDHALRHSDRVMVIVGSSNVVDERNPFTTEERISMLKLLYPYIDIASKKDVQGDDFKWASQLALTVMAFTKIPKVEHVKLFYHRKLQDEKSGSHYMDLLVDAFTRMQWPTTIETLPMTHKIHATDIRYEYLHDQDNYHARSFLPEVIDKFIRNETNFLK